MYSGINGLQMFYEIRGTADPVTVPVVLLPGAISATGTSFGPLPDLLAQTRQVIAVERQGHGRTAESSLEAEPRPRAAGPARNGLAQALRIDLNPGLPPSRRSRASRARGMWELQAPLAASGNPTPLWR